MDYPQQREKYLKVYPEYFEKLVLDKDLENAVKNFCPILWEKNKEPIEVVIKSYILLELTKTRESCDHIINLLSETKHPINSELAKGLKEFNTSPGYQDQGDAPKIWVRPILPKNVTLFKSATYRMTKKSRGKAIIINVVPNDVIFEAQRFYFVFKQLLFETQVLQALTTAQIQDHLTKIANDIRKKKEDMDQALIVMIISHGSDEKIVGINHPACDGSNPKDIVSCVNIVDIFSGAALSGLVKIFFFTCCREINEKYRNPTYMTCADQTGLDTNINTFIYNSCAEGYETDIEPNSFYTYYGRVLSDSIAQYAHKEHLAEIITRVNKVLQDRLKQTYQNEEGTPVPRRKIGFFAPQGRENCTTQRVYFNPGWYEGM